MFRPIFIAFSLHLTVKVGINIREPLETFSLESWNKVMDVNLTGAFLITQACSPRS